MATLAHGGTLPDSSQKTGFYGLIDNGTVSNIVNADIGSGAGITDAKLAPITTAGKVSTNALYTPSQAQGDVIYHNGTNWVRLPHGNSGEFLQTKGASANPEWGIAGIVGEIRYGMQCKYASAVTVTIDAGQINVGTSVITKATATTLNLTTAAHWAGGVSLQTTTSFGYIGVDASGNLKLHTTAPAFADYGLTVTIPTKLYVSWASTTYRVIGWFYMNATGAGEINAWEAGNVKCGDIFNEIEVRGTTDITSVATGASWDDMTGMEVNFYTSGKPVVVDFDGMFMTAGSVVTSARLNVGGAIKATSSKADNTGFYIATPIPIHYTEQYAQGTKNIKIQWQVDTGTGNQLGSSNGARVLRIREM